MSMKNRLDYSGPRSLRRWALLSMVLCLALVAAACGDTGDDAAPEEPAAPEPGPDPVDEPDEEDDTLPWEDQEPEVTTILQPTITISALAVPSQMPYDLGLYEKYGIDIEWVEAASSEANNLYVAGEFNWGWTLASMVPTMLTVDQPIEVHGIEIDKYVYGFYVQPEIESFEDLAGQRVGISQFGGNPHLATLALFEHVGFDPEENDVTFQAVGRTSDIVGAMLTGEIAAGAFGTPGSVIAEREGMVKLFDMLELTDAETVGITIIGNPDWVAEHPNAAKAWIRGYLEGRWILQTDPETTKGVLADRLELDPSDPDDAEMLEASYAEVVAAQTWLPDTPDVERWIDILRAEYAEPERVGDIRQALPSRNLIQEVIDEGFLEWLEQEYGPLPQ